MHKYTNHIINYLGHVDATTRSSVSVCKIFSSIANVLFSQGPRSSIMIRHQF